jgi:hypothetical protein
LDFDDVWSTWMTSASTNLSSSKSFLYSASIFPISGRQRNYKQIKLCKYYKQINITMIIIDF